MLFPTVTLLVAQGLYLPLLSQLIFEARRSMSEASKVTFTFHFDQILDAQVPPPTLLKMVRYYSTTMCHYWDMSVK